MPPTSNITPEDHNAKGNFWAFYAALVFISIAANYPGRANSDTVDMLSQATDLTRLNDWHSPFITFAYGFLGPLFGYPAGALIVQSLLLMTWPALLGARIGGLRLHPAITVAAYALWGGLCALVIALSGQIIKDMLLVAFMSFFLFLEMQTRRNAEILLGEIICAAGIILIRPVNGLLIVPVLMVGIFFSKSQRKTLPLASALIATALITAAAPSISRNIFGAQKTVHEFGVTVFDIAGISTNLHKNLFRELDPKSPYPDPWTCYIPDRGTVFMWGGCKQYFPIFASRNSELTELWKRSILRYPIAYLKHRAMFAVKLLDLDGSGRDGIITSFPLFGGGIANTPEGISAVGKLKPTGLQFWHPTIAFDPFGRLWNGVYATFLGFPLTWCLIILAATGIALMQKPGETEKLVLMASAFGLSNVVLFIFFGPDDTQRYLLPTWFCAVVDVCYFVQIAFFGVLNSIIRSAERYEQINMRSESK